MSNKKERNITIDVLRGIATLSVLLGHAIQRGMVVGYEESVLFRLIYTFHMPLFMFLSGYTLFLSNPKYDSKFIINKFKRLIIPTIIFSFLLYFVKDVGFTGLNPFVQFPDSIVKYAALLMIRPDFLIWFLYIVFICTFIFFIGHNFFQKHLSVFLLITTAAVLLFPIEGYFGIWRLELYLPIFITGYYAAKHKGYFLKYSKYALIPLTIFYVLNWDRWSFSSPLIYQWMIAASGVTILFYLVKFIRIKPVDKIFVFFGRYSLEIYLWQCFVLNIGIGDGAVRVFSIFISATALSALLSYLTQKNKYTNMVLYGRFRWLPKVNIFNKDVAQ